ncbi:MAG: LysE family translocator [Rhodobacteraceae bacterium]|nr:LysE family translocator [Paracoccaceae bacterium]
MTYDLFLALAAFAFVSSITPGPNNLMLMASGANFGFRRTVPHMLGVAIGFVVMVLLVGSGLAQVFDAYPVSRLILTVVGAVYMLWLAWRIATAAPASSTAQGTEGRPLTFLQAAAFQWVNPKAWAMALTAITVHAPDHSIGGILLVGAIFGAINLPAVGSWCLLGERMAQFLTEPRHLIAFNRAMAAALVLSLWPLLAR